MAKGGKGRKGGGGGGGKTRKYSRDNNGRFASTGTGATARGGRLATAKGNKRKTQTITAAGQKGVLAKPKGLKPGAIKPKAAAKPAAVAAAPKAAKLPREQRLARAKVTAKRIDQKLKAKADETGAAFAERRRISSRASSKARTAAFEKEAVAGKASATALRASQRSNARVTRLAEEQGKYAQPARGAATKPAAKPAPKSPEPAVKIAKRKPKTPAEIAAGREADRREMASILRKPARWLAPTPVAKPATLSTKAKTPKFTTEQSGRVRRAALGGGRTAIVRKNSAVIINAKGEPIMTRKGLPNITAGKKYAANPNARGPRIMGRDRSEASPSRGYIRTSKPTGTIGKPKGLKPGSIKPKAAAAAKPAPAPKATKPKGKAKIDDSKVSRVISRVNDVVRGSEQKTGVKRLNAIQVGVRAKSFLARKEGGNVGILNQKSQPEAFSSVRKAMTKPPRYSTQKPSRNKPGRFNDLGQDKLRAKARTDAMTGRERIAKANESAVAKAKERKGKIPTGTISRRSLPQLGAPRAPGYVKGPRQTGTMAKPKIASTPVSSTVARTRIKAKAAQRNRREQILDRTRTGFSGISKMKKNPRIKRSDTGMRQLSLVGKAKTLYRFKHIKPRSMR